MADIVEIFLLLRNARKFIEDAGKSSKAVKGVGDAAEKSGKKASAGWKGMAKWAGGAAAIYGATRYLKHAVHDTEDLAKQTLRLSRVTGMSIEKSSEWAELLKVRGMSTNTVEVALVKLSKEIDKVNKANTKQAVSMKSLNEQYKATALLGGKKAPAALDRLTKKMAAAGVAGAKARKTFADLHVSSRALAEGNTDAVFNQVAQAMSKMRDPARRLALAQQLFGRGGRTLLPILLKGREGIQDQLNVVKKYGAYLNVHSVKDLQEMIAHQRELKIAQDGLKIQLSLALLPALFQIEKQLIRIVHAFQALTKHTWLFRAAVIAVAAAFLYYKTVMLIATIATTVFEGAAAPLILLLALIPLLIIALVVGFVILYKRCAWFRKAVDATWRAVKVAFAAMVQAFKFVWQWVKDNWPLLLSILTGPFGALTIFVIRHFGQIKTFIGNVITWIKTAFNNLIQWVKSVPGKFIESTVGKIPGAKTLLKGAGAAAGLFGVHFKGQAGGVVPYRSNVLVGERGPEILSMPGGARVTPLPQPGVALAGGLSQPIEVTVISVLDGREIGRSVARVTADKLARR